MYASNHFEKAFLNTMLGTALTAPANLYMGLLMSDPKEGATIQEVSYTGYERQAVKFTVPAKDNALQAIAIKNAEQIVFPQADATAGTVTFVGLFDSATAGNLWGYCPAREQLDIRMGERPVVLQNEVVFYLTGSLSDHYKTALLNVLRGTSLEGFTPYLALWNKSPDQGGAAELAGDNYSRISLTFSAPSEQTSGQMTVQNTETKAFPRPSTQWGSWTHTVICDSETGGHAVWIDPLPAPRPVKTGYMPMVDTGSVKVGLN